MARRRRIASDEDLEAAYREFARDEEAVREALEWSNALIGDGLSFETEEDRRANEDWYREWLGNGWTLPRAGGTTG